MILIGALTETVDVAGHCRRNTGFYDDCSDVHEAARDIWKIAHGGNSFWIRTLLKAEFHDTGTQRTWSVDSCGHSRGDYCIETTENFKARWT